MEGDQRTACFQRHLPAIKRRLVGRRVKRQIEEGQGDHHLGEVSRCFREMDRAEGEGRITFGIVEPEPARPDEIRILHGQTQVAVVVLGPFLRRGEGSVEGAEAEGVLIAVETRDSSINAVGLLFFVAQLLLLRELSPQACLDLTFYILTETAELDRFSRQGVSIGGFVAGDGIVWPSPWQRPTITPESPRKSRRRIGRHRLAGLVTEPGQPVDG